MVLKFWATISPSKDPDVAVTLPVNSPSDAYTFPRNSPLVAVTLPLISTSLAYNLPFVKLEMGLMFLGFGCAGPKSYTCICRAFSCCPSFNCRIIAGKLNGSGCNDSSVNSGFVLSYSTASTQSAATYSPDSRETVLLRITLPLTHKSPFCKEE